MNCMYVCIYLRDLRRPLYEPCAVAAVALYELYVYYMYISARLAPPSLRARARLRRGGRRPPAAVDASRRPGGRLTLFESEYSV